MHHLSKASYELWQHSKHTGQDGEPAFHGVTTSNKVFFQIQDGPIGENGVNGLQATDMLFFCKELFKSLNSAFPCRENSLTITKIEEALHWQEARTKDRVKRKVEGFNKG